MIYYFDFSEVMFRLNILKLNCVKIFYCIYLNVNLLVYFLTHDDQLFYYNFWCLVDEIRR